jgi:hypothetical protein
VHDTGREVVEFAGPDAGAFLHSQFAQDIASVPVHGSVHSLLLEPTGHLVTVARVTRVDEETWWVDVDEGSAVALQDRLRRFILRAKVTMTPTDLVCVCLRGPDARNVAREVVGSSVANAVMRWDLAAADADSCELVGQRAELPAVTATRESFEADRADAGWPRLGADLVAGDLPATTGLLGVAVSFTKGCYPGQELVERMDSRGAGPPESLRLVDRELVGADGSIEVDGVAVGRATSVGDRRAIARIKRGVAIGTVLCPDA